MAEINRAVKGTNDILPSDSHKWQFVEGKIYTPIKKKSYPVI